MSARCTCWNVTTCDTNRRLGSTSHGENVPHKQHWPLPFKTETERAYLQTGKEAAKPLARVCGSWKLRVPVLPSFVSCIFCELVQLHYKGGENNSKARI